MTLALCQTDRVRRHQELKEMCEVQLREEKYWDGEIQRNERVHQIF